MAAEQRVANERATSEDRPGVTNFLSLALLTFDVGVAYATWTSVADVGIVVLGALFFGQRLDWRKLLSIAAVIAGVVGLQLSGAA